MGSQGRDTVQPETQYLSAMKNFFSLFSTFKCGKEKCQETTLHQDQDLKADQCDGEKKQTKL